MLQKKLHKFKQSKKISEKINENLKKCLASAKIRTADL